MSKPRQADKASCHRRRVSAFQSPRTSDVPGLPLCLTYDNTPCTQRYIQSWQAGNIAELELRSSYQLDNGFFSISFKPRHAV
jgi:hypothetical protein